MNKIKLSHSSKFYLFVFPEFSFIKAGFDKKTKKYDCDVDDDLAISHSVFLIDFKKVKITKLNFKKYPSKKPTFKIQYPIVFNTEVTPKLGKPIDLNLKPVLINKKPKLLDFLKSTKITNEPIDLSISKNITICQTHLKQQIQTCPTLSQ